jgi:hypothetical protein
MFGFGQHGRRSGRLSLETHLSQLAVDHPRPANTPGHAESASKRGDGQQPERGRQGLVVGQPATAAPPRQEQSSRCTAASILL